MEFKIPQKKTEEEENDFLDIDQPSFAAVLINQLIQTYAMYSTMGIRPLSDTSRTYMKMRIKQ